MEESWGLAAVGRVGRFTVDVDKAISDSERWELTLEGPAWYLRLAIAGPATVARWLGFMKLYAGRTETAEHTVGSFLGSPVLVIKDDEFADRFFLVAGGSHALRLTLAGTEAEALIGALAQAAADLPEAA
jgi:hypothetical protein